MINEDDYRELYLRSLTDPDAFWSEQARRLNWRTPFSSVKDTSFAYPDVKIAWFADGALNVCENCVDRHALATPDRTAIIWEPDDPNVEPEKISYKELLANVCRTANILHGLGVRKGDRVVIYLPMIPEAAYAMLACARIGAIHSVVFAGFSPEALANRIEDSQAKLLITADESVRGGKRTPLLKNADIAMRRCSGPVQSLVVRRHIAASELVAGRDHDYDALLAAASDVFPCEPMDAEHPLFILYTSGSTGKPKGVVHSSAGYLLYASMTHEYVFDYRASDIYWCTADVGWVTGHSYILYGPLANGATTLMFEGVPTYPDPSRFWQICQKHRVNQFYTAPTAIRALMGQGDSWVTDCDLSSLRVIGTVGEPINPEAWKWYSRVVGGDLCSVVDTWWQTETGGHMITPIPGAIPTKPGSATKPFFGVRPVVLEPSTGSEKADPEAEGVLCIKDSWPGQMRTVYGDHQRFLETYFQQYPGYFFTGDGCYRDADGDYWITGRVDDVLNVSGHRMGTAELESALVAHPVVAEAAVVGCPHEIKGQGVYAYVTLNSGVTASEALRQELVAWVGKEIGPIAKPEIIQWAPGLPKTRSGKIMRRILRKIAEDDVESLGDTSTLAEPAVVEDLVKNRARKHAGK